MKSRYGIGDRVVLHGYPGLPPGHRRDGFVGTVQHIGSSFLTGVTDDGRAWSEYPGALEPEDHDIAAATDGYRCTCHTRPWIAVAGGYVVPQSDHGPGGIHHVPEPEQLDLFAVPS